VEGIKRTEKLTKLLVRNGFTIVSGLATGIDTVAHRTAISQSGQTIAVIGTPLSSYYPKVNKTLQRLIAREHLLITQVPICRYYQQDWKLNRHFFPERNITMSALTEGTIIVEASDTSGTLIQARAALKQKRKLFILDSCFQFDGLRWPHSFEKRGAVRVGSYEDIEKHLV
jgi:DNA processing protein